MIKLLFPIMGELHELPYQKWQFPGGEIGIKLPVEKLKDLQLGTEGYHILWTFQNNAEFFELANLVDAIRQYHKSFLPQAESEICLTIPYLPYARQDRKCHPGESFALNVFGDLLNSLILDAVITMDVHSQVATDLIDNLHSANQANCMANLPRYDFLIAPDAGAKKKIMMHRQVNYQENPTQVICLEKKRVGSEVFTLLPMHLPFDLEGKSVCVVDDICDGGATFMACAESLAQFNLAKLDLAVTHGIFSKGTDALFTQYDTIYAVNLINRNVTQVKELSDVYQSYPSL